MSTSTSITRRRSMLGCSIVLACSLPLSLQAQMLDYLAMEELFGEPVTYSVTGSPQRAGKVPATMEIITAEQIRRSGALDVAGLLRQVTGIDVQRRTNNGADLAIRGYNKAFSPRLLVLVNGRQVYVDHYGYMPWSSLPVEMGEIHQIEVVKGPNSALYGFNATAGVINIITKSPDDQDVDFLEIRSGTQRQRQGSAAGTFKPVEQVAVRVSGGLRRNEDFSTPTGPVNQVARQDNERRSLRLDVHYRPQANLHFEVEASHTATDQTNMVPAYVIMFEEMEVNSLRVSAGMDTRFGLSELHAYTNRTDNQAFSASYDFATFAYNLTSVPVANFNNDLNVVQLQHVFKPGIRHVFRLGLEHRDGSLDTTPVTGARLSYDVFAGSAMWQWQLLPSLALTTALRQDRLELGRSGLMPPGLALSNADWNRSITRTSYNAGLVWEPDSNNTLRLTSARGVQLPSLYNLGGQLVALPIPPELQPPEVLYQAGLPTLHPSIVTNHELSWDHRLADLGAELRVAVFTAESRNLVADSAISDLARGLFSAPGNIGSSDTRGYEITLKGTVAGAWKWSLGYLHQDVDDNIDQLLYPTWLTMTDYENTTARHTANLNLGWTRGPWEVDGFLRFQSANGGIRADESFLFDPNDPLKVPSVEARLDSFTTFDARIGYRWNERVQLALSGQNLLQSEQIQTAGPAVERRIFATLTYEF